MPSKRHKILSDSENESIPTSCNSHVCSSTSVSSLELELGFGELVDSSVENEIRRVKELQQRKSNLKYLDRKNSNRLKYSPKIKMTATERSGYSTPHRQCSSRIDELARPLKRNCIDSYQSRVCVLSPEVTCSPRSKTQTPVSSRSAVSMSQMFEYIRGEEKLKRNNYRYTHDFTIGNNDLFPRNFCLVLAHRIAQELLPLYNEDIDESLRPLSDFVLGDIMGLMDLDTDEDKNNPTIQPLVGEISNRIAVWIDDVLSHADQKIVENFKDEPESLGDGPNLLNEHESVIGNTENESSPGPDLSEELVDNIVDLFPNKSKKLNETGVRKLDIQKSSDKLELIPSEIEKSNENRTKVAITKFNATTSTKDVGNTKIHQDDVGQTNQASFDRVSEIANDHKLENVRLNTDTQCEQISKQPNNKSGSSRTIKINRQDWEQVLKQFSLNMESWSSWINTFCVDVPITGGNGFEGIFKKPTEVYKAKNEKEWKAFRRSIETEATKWRDEKLINNQCSQTVEQNKVVIKDAPGNLSFPVRTTARKEEDMMKAIANVKKWKQWLERSIMEVNNLIKNQPSLEHDQQLTSLKTVLENKCEKWTKYSNFMEERWRAKYSIDDLSDIKVSNEVFLSENNYDE